MSVMHQTSNRLEIMSGRSLTYIRDFLSEEIDMIVSGHDFSLIKGVEQHHICTQRFVAISPRMKADHYSDLRDMAQKLPLIRFRKTTRVDDLVSRYLRGQGIELPRVIECSSPATMLRLVASGHGWLISTPLSICWFRDVWDRLACWELEAPMEEGLYLAALEGRFMDVPSDLASSCRESIKDEIANWAGSPIARFQNAVTFKAPKFDLSLTSYDVIT